jgi:hypothetical protein
MRKFDILGRAKWNCNQPSKNSTVSLFSVFHFDLYYDLVSCLTQAGDRHVRQTG